MHLKFSRILKGILLFTLFLTFNLQFIKAQENHEKIKIKAGFSSYPARSTSQDNIWNAEIQGYYQLKNYLGVGLYANYTPDFITRMSFRQFGYGANVEFNFLPFLLKKQTRFDVYARVKLGGAYTDLHYYQTHHLDYALNGGLAIYPFRKFGLFVETGLRRYQFKHKEGINLQYGLSIRF